MEEKVVKGRSTKSKVMTVLLGITLFCVFSFLLLAVLDKGIVKKNNIRLDSYLANNLDISRSKIKKLLDEGKILVNDKIEKASYKV